MLTPLFLPLWQSQISIEIYIIVGFLVLLGVLLIAVVLNFQTRVSTNSPLEQMFKRIRTLESEIDILRKELHDLKNDLNSEKQRSALLALENSFLRQQLKQTLGTATNSNIDEMILYTFNVGELKRFLSDKLGIELSHIVSEDRNMQEIAYEVVKWFKRQGRTEELKEALERNI